MGEATVSTEVLEPLTDDELTELALAADPDAALPDDATSFWDMSPVSEEPLLPDWCMPSPMAGTVDIPRWWRWVAVTIIVAFLAINAYGLCSTYGEIVLA